MEKKFTNDPENYYELSKPFESPEIANKALSDFYNEIAELRKKYKISDILVVVYASSKYPDGNIGSFLNTHSYGNSLLQEVLAAYAFGEAQAEKREQINSIVKRANKS